jgi:PBP1b-binding outer membrane lipoprotein LpoB
MKKIKIIIAAILIATLLMSCGSANYNCGFTSVNKKEFKNNFS